MSHPSLEQQVTFLYANDLQKTAHFYEEVLELPLVLDQGSCRIYDVCGSGFLGICQSTEVVEEPKGIIFTFATHEVDEWYYFLSEKGVAFEKPPVHNPKFKLYHCFLRDPNGYLLEIQQFLDPAWPGNKPNAR
jgi:catechol 2,3-dioxygenase-like lactoylglutathione lyase family enzyme